MRLNVAFISQLELDYYISIKARAHLLVYELKSPRVQVNIGVLLIKGREDSPLPCAKRIFDKVQHAFPVLFIRFPCYHPRPGDCAYLINQALWPLT